MPDHYPITVFQALKNFRSVIANFKNETFKSYRKILLSFEHFALERYFYDAPFSPQLVFEWYSFLRLKGLTLNKCYYYVDKLGNLYSSARKNSLSPDPLFFREIRKKIKETDSHGLSPLPVSFKNVDILFNILKDKNKDPEKYSLGFDLLLFSLCNPGLSLHEIAELKRAQLPATNPLSLNIAKKYLEPKRSYVFPLSQADSTKKQLRQTAGLEISKALAAIGIKQGQTDPLLPMLWIALAVRIGISPAIAAAALSPIPEAYPFLALCSQPKLSPEQSKELQTKVAESLRGDVKHWYAMRLRPYVKYDQLIAGLATLKDKELLPELFYPREEIARQAGKKIVWKEKPVIHDIVFFKTHPDRVYPLFRNIWQIAWCYRDISGKGYAAIPDAAMDSFREAIGFLTPDYEIAPAGELPLRPGDKVIVIDGDFKNHLAQIISNRNGSLPTSEENPVFRIRLLDASHSWEIAIDARLLRPAP